MPEQLKVLDLFSGIRPAVLALDFNALECALSPFAKSSLSAEQCCESIGLMFRNTTTYERLPQKDLPPMASGQLTLFAGDSHARTYPLQGKAPALKASAAACGESTPVLLASYDLDSSLWRTSQLCLGGELAEFSETWPRSGMTRNGKLFQRQTLARHTKGNESGLWPTPTANFNTTNQGEALRARARDRIVPNYLAEAVIWPTPRSCSAMGATFTPAAIAKAANRSPNLETVVQRRTWPTPQASDVRDRGNLSSGAVQRRLQRGKQLMLSQVVSEINGALNPIWVEGLMGFPIGWSDIAEKE